MRYLAQVTGGGFWEVLSQVPILGHRNLDVLLLYGKQSWSDGLGSKAAVICLCFFISPVRLSSRNASSSNTVSLFISLELLLLCFWDIIFRYILDIQRKIFKNSMFVGMLFKAIERTHALAPKCLCEHIPASVLLSPEQNQEYCSLVVLCSPMEGSGFNVLTDCSNRLRDCAPLPLVSSVWASLCAERLGKQDTCNLRVHSGSLLPNACSSQLVKVLLWYQCALHCRCRDLMDDGLIDRLASVSWEGLSSAAQAYSVC